MGGGVETVMATGNGQRFKRRVSHYPPVLGVRLLGFPTITQSTFLFRLLPSHLLYSTFCPYFAKKCASSLPYSCLPYTSPLAYPNLALAGEELPPRRIPIHLALNAFSLIISVQSPNNNIIRPPSQFRGLALPISILRSQNPPHSKRKDAYLFVTSAEAPQTAFYRSSICQARPLFSALP